MVTFDTSLDFAPIEVANTDPILPEDRFIFELIGLERSEPDQWRKEGGVKWTFLTFNADGSPFMFKEEQYQLFRTIGLDKKGRPNINQGTQGYDWACALAGKELSVGEKPRVADLLHKRMSAMVVWEKQRSDPTKKTIKLASLRHVPTGSAPAVAAQVSADPSIADVDRALLITTVDKLIKRAEKLGTAKHLDWLTYKPDQMTVEDLDTLKQHIALDIENSD